MLITAGPFSTFAAMEDKELTQLSEIGEFGLIERLTSGIELKNENTVLGVGDDAAVIKGGDRLILISTDLLVEGVHFDLTYMPLQHLGYKAAVVNFSDIAAMNGKPAQLLVSMAVSSRFTAEALDEIYKGIRKACEVYGVDLVGGDTSSSRAGLILSLCILGEADAGEVTYRSGASEGDLLCVSGDLGGAYTGLLLLEREKKVFEADPNMQPQLEGNDYILERQLKPEARFDVLRSLKDAGIKPSSMIDISDGLASEILHLCKASDLGCNLYEDKIPVDQQTFDRLQDFSIDPTVAALSGGEDYELLFTISQADFEKIKELTSVSIIGHMTEKGSPAQLVSRAGTMHPLTAQGWDAMRKEITD